MSSWQQQEVLDGFLDLDATANPISLRLFTLTTDEQRQTQWSQEIQAVAAALDDRLRLTTGLYGFWEDTGGGDMLTSSFGQQRQERTEIANTSYAVYGQASVTPLQWLELTGGLRETWERKNAERTIVTPPPPNEQKVENASDSFSQFTPMASVAFKAPADLIKGTPLGSGIFYFTYSQGYKSGGFATRRDPSLLRIGEFDSEELDNYELGLKLELFDHRVLFNTAFFYSEYDDIQLTVLRVNPNSPPGQPDAGSTIANAGEATIQGLELELITRPWRELVVRGSLGLTDAEYDEFIDQTWDINPGTGLVQNIRPLDRSDEDFINVPELSIDGSVEYPIELSALGLRDYGTLTPIAHVYYQTETNTPHHGRGLRVAALPPGRLHAARSAPDLGRLGRPHSGVALRQQPARHRLLRFGDRSHQYARHRRRLLQPAAHDRRRDPLSLALPELPRVLVSSGGARENGAAIQVFRRTPRARPRARVRRGRPERGRRAHAPPRSSPPRAGRTARSRRSRRGRGRRSARSRAA